VKLPAPLRLWAGKLGINKPEPTATLHVGGTLAVDGATTLTGGVAQQARQAIIFGSGWLWYDTSSWDGGFWKDAEGVVHLEGLVTTNSATPATPMFVLPAGYRPFKTQMFAQMAWSATGALFTRVDIGSNGNFVYVPGQAWGHGSATTFTPSATPTAAWISLHGITFRTT
jgi:hypothetical protein